MPIDTTHPEYNPSSASVTIDAYEGNVLDYIPRLTRQTDHEYEAYRQRGVYFNVTKKTTEAMIGAALRKPYVTDVQDVLCDDDLTLHELVSQILRGILLEGKVGLLTDWCDDEQSPKIIMYGNHHITNWRSDDSLVVFQEMVYEEDPRDPYELVQVEQYRECFIDDETGVYTVRLWRQEGSGTTKSKWVVVDEFVPMRRGQPLDFIPFTFINPFDTSQANHPPVMLNMAQLNISHFKSVVDIEHGCHFTALPQPWIAGEFSEDQGAEVVIGSTFPWIMENDSKVGYLEFTGAGLQKVQERITNKEEQMAVLGTQLLARKGVEAAESLRIRSAAETATLNNVVNAVESGIQQSLTHYNFWMGSEQDAEFEMNRDFSGRVLTAPEMKSLMDLYLAGTISQETFLENLFEGEIAPEVQEEMTRLEADESKQEEESQEERDNALFERTDETSGE